MPGFCVNCGTPLTGPFCNNCGARAVPAAPGASATPTPPSAPTPQAGYQTVNLPGASVRPVSPTPVQSYQPVQASVGTTSKGSGLGKVLLWVGGILLVMFMVGAGAAIYGVYWVKHKVTNYASAISGGSSDSVRVVAKGDSCVANHVRIAESAWRPD